MDFSSIFEKITEVTQRMELGESLSMILRPVFVFLALFVLIRCIVSLVRAKNPPEVWAYLKVVNYRETEGGSYEKVSEIVEPLTHWENVIGRARSCDITIKDGGVSRNHGLLIRDEEGTWSFRDIGSQNGTWLNSSEESEVNFREFRRRGSSDRNAYLDYAAQLNGPSYRANDFIQISKGKGNEAPAIEL